MPKRIDCPEGMGWCGRCKQFLPRDKFNLEKSKRNGIEAYCKGCRRNYTRKRCDQTPLVIPPVGHKYCPECDTVKPDSEFSTYLLKKTQLRSHYCKACASYVQYKRPPKRRLSQKFLGENHQSVKEAQYIISSNPLELAYAAGVFDAEGSIQLQPNNTARPFLSVHADSEEMLSAVQRAIGGKILFFDRLQKPKGKTIRPEVQVSNGKLSIGATQDVLRACEALLPYLVLKRDRAEIAIKACASLPEERFLLRPVLDAINQKGLKEDPVNANTRSIDQDQANSISETDVAYLAGYIDGDGWIGLSNASQPVMTITSSKKKIIEHIFSIFGGNVKSLGLLKPHHATRTAWRMCGSRMIFRIILLKLSNFLTLKKKHAELIIESLDAALARRIKIDHELKALTKYNREEKFRRLENQKQEKVMEKKNEQSWSNQDVPSVDPLSPTPSERQDIEIARKYVQQFVHVNENAQNESVAQVS